MIHFIRFRNYYSFGIDEEAQWAEIDFRVSDDASENKFTFRTPSGVRLNKVLAVIGPNASGKTNLLRAASFLRYFMLDSHLYSKPGENIPLASHLFEKSDQIQFEIKFELEDGRHLLYLLDITTERVVRESLTATNTLATNKPTPIHTIIDRQWDIEHNKYQHTFSKDLGYAPTDAYPLRANVSSLSTARQNDGPLVQAIDNALHRGVFNVTRKGNTSMQSQGLAAASRLLKNEPEILSACNTLLGGLDLGISRIEITEEKLLTPQGEKINTLSPIAFHHYSGEEKALDFYDESSGTKALLTILPTSLVALSNSSISVWDEMESDLHPDIAQAMIRLFLHPETNPNNAQIIFSSHNHEVLRVLNPSQAILVEKEDGVFSVARRLDTIEGVTEDDNLYARYRTRAYGAKPEIQLDQAVARFVAEANRGNKK